MENVYQEIYDRISKNKPILPSMPDIGLKILTALNVR